MAPFGAAIGDYFFKEPHNDLISVREDGLRRTFPLADCFRNSSSLRSLERIGLGLCRGRVLDCGAGAGPHSLFLQERDISVCAIDVCAEAVSVALSRGVREAFCVGLNDIDTLGEFDTLLLLTQGIGMVESLHGLERFWAQARKLLRKNGQVLVESFDVRKARQKHLLDYQERLERDGRYRGELRMHFEYRSVCGSSFGWLQMDPETLVSSAAAHWFGSHILKLDEGGAYIAQCIKQD
jgi:SAM-dependent methyltransferase